MSGFQSPNYTQVPNDYFDLVMEMTTAENRVLAILLRSTFGYHRDEIKLSIRELARLTKLSPQSVMDGAKRLEARQLIERTVSETSTTNWRVLVKSDTKLYQKIVKTVPDGSSKIPSPHTEKEKKKENDDDRAALAQISKAYESEIGVLTPMIADELQEAASAYPLKWTLDAIREAATQNKRGWKYILAILARWKAQGNQEAMKPPAKGYAPKEQARPYTPIPSVTETAQKILQKSDEKFVPRPPDVARAKISTLTRKMEAPNVSR